MHPRPLALLSLLLALAAGCAHTQRADSSRALKQAAEGFHHRIRWGDFRSAAEYLVPDRRRPFSEARERGQDERDLSFSDYELEQLTLAEDGLSADVVSRLRWTRLPSLVEKSETVHSHFVLLRGQWLLAEQDKGPFTDVLGAPWDPGADKAP
ncbi:MAG: hypothetical protein RL653_831 [Pseudomonadota bacterium]|jgi:hypothetical protein